MPPFTLRPAKPHGRPHAWTRFAWIAPYVGLWSGALLVLRDRVPGAECAATCVVVDAWLWYTVLYAGLSLTALIGALEVALLLYRGRAPADRTRARYH